MIRHGDTGVGVSSQWVGLMATEMTSFGGVMCLLRLLICHTWVMALSEGELSLCI